MPKDNPLDHKLPKNDLAGKGANAKGKQRFRSNPLSGFGKGKDVRCKNKLAFPAGRHSLVFRSMLDGVKLIEAIEGDDAYDMRQSAVAIAKRWGGVQKAKSDPEFQRLVHGMSVAVHGDSFHTAAIMRDIRQDLLSEPPEPQSTLDSTGSPWQWAGQGA